MTSHKSLFHGMNQQKAGSGALSRRPLRANKKLLASIAIVVLLATGSMLGQRTRPAGNPVELPQAVPASAPSSLAPSNLAPLPYAAPRVATGRLDSLGRPISVSCASCHANFKLSEVVESGEQLDQFHQGLMFRHGKVTCLTCHHAENYNLLRLADRQSLDFSNSQPLCSQCHSKQSNDYDHGAHGGMNGHWNLARGGRVRKLCIDCHDPHAPAFPAMVPTFKSHDRFLEPTNPGHQANSNDRKIQF